MKPRIKWDGRCSRGSLAIRNYAHDSKNFVETHMEPTNPSDALRATMKDFPTLLKAGDKDFNLQDADFMRGMVKHHEMALTMSATEIDKGKNDVAVALAKSIVISQKSQIALMKKWLKDRDLAGADLRLLRM
jgi:uncharacterized protein (DUF305 family)